jgi:hypothetical protein
MNIKPGEFVDRTRIITLAETSLCGLTNQSRLRKLAVSVVENKRFDSFIMACIMLNSLFMAMFDYEAENRCDYEQQLLGNGSCFADVRSNWNLSINWAGDIFGFIFTLEAIFKIISYGLVLD